MADRDALGRLLPGHKVSHRNGEAIIPHPLFPGRDTYGRTLPRDYGGIELQEIRQALLNSLTPKRVNLMTDRLFKLINSKDEKVALGALALAYNYFMGKPSQRVEVQKATVSMSKEQMDEMLKAANL